MVYGFVGIGVIAEVGLRVDVFEHAAVSPGEESSTDGADDGSEQVDPEDGGVESLLLNLVLEGGKGDRNGRVERSTGVGSGNEDHGGESRGDGEASHPSVSVSSEPRSGVLDEEVSHDEDSGAHSLNAKGLPELSLGLEDGELLEVFAVAFGDNAHVEEFHADEGSNELGGEHVEELNKSLEVPLVVDQDSDRDSRVVMGSGDGSSQKKEEEQSQADSDGVSLGGDNSADEEESADELV